MPGTPELRTMGGVSLEPCPVCDGTPRVLVAVRHPIMRRYAAELLARECGCWASSDVAAGEMLPDAIDRFRPELLVVDAGDFPACCQAAIDAFPRDRVVVIGPEPDPSYGAAALAHGAAACIARDDVGEELVPTMRAILCCRHEHCPPAARGAGRVIAAAGVRWRLDEPSMFVEPTRLIDSATRALGR